MNAIIKDVAKLMRSLRDSDIEELAEARNTLQAFADSWLVSGESKNLQGAGDCCLSDTDLATAVVPVIDQWIETRE